MIESVIFIAASMHIGGGEYNQTNPGLAIRHKHVVAGVYENSFYDTSAFVAYDMNWKHDEIEYGFLSGGVTGYEYDWTVGDMTAFVAPYVTYHTESISPTVLLLGNAITLSFKVEL